MAVNNWYITQLSNHSQLPLREHLKRAGGNAESCEIVLPMEKKAATEIDYNIVEQNNPVCKEHSTSCMWSYPPILDNF